MNVPVFQNYCLDWEDVLSCPDVLKMQSRVEKQSRTEEAKRRVDLAHYKEKYGNDDNAPAYFGAFTEWYGKHFLNFFGHAFNLHNVTMHDCVGGTVPDYGVDGIAITSADVEGRFGANRSPRAGYNVYIQVKGAFSPKKVYSPNDGSRLTNFMSYAQTQAVDAGQAYQARYVLFTTGKNIDHNLEAMTGNRMEVIGITKIKKHAHNNLHFLNVLRDAAGLDPFELVPKLDEEALQYAQLPEVDFQG